LPGDAARARPGRGDAAGAGPLDPAPVDRGAAGRAARSTAVLPGPGRVLRDPQGGAAGAGPGRLRRLGGRPAPGRVTHPCAYPGGALRSRPRQGEGQPARHLEPGGRGRLHRTLGRAGQSAALPGVRVGRLLAVHPADPGRGGPAGRPVAAVRQDRVRPAYLMSTGVMLVAHGSADPRAAATTRALGRAVAAARPGLDVRTAYLDHAGPRPGEVLAEFAAGGHARAVVVPLLLTCAYHGRVDLPQVLAAAAAAGIDLPVRVSDVLGPVGALVPVLRRSAQSGRRVGDAPAGYDAVVLAATDTREAGARGTVAAAARERGAALGVPCGEAYAAGAAPTPGEAGARLREQGARK